MSSIVDGIESIQTLSFWSCGKELYPITSLHPVITPLLIIYIYICITYTLCSSRNSVARSNVKFNFTAQQWDSTCQSPTGPGRLIIVKNDRCTLGRFARRNYACTQLRRQLSRSRLCLRLQRGEKKVKKTDYYTKTSRELKRDALQTINPFSSLQGFQKKKKKKNVVYIYWFYVVIATRVDGPEVISNKSRLRQLHAWKRLWDYAQPKCTRYIYILYAQDSTFTVQTSSLAHSRVFKDL